MSRTLRSFAGCSIAVLAAIAVVVPCWSTSVHEPGDLIVVFNSSDTPTINVDQAGFPSVYPQLDALLQENEVENAKPLFTANSPLSQ